MLDTPAASRNSGAAQALDLASIARIARKPGDIIRLVRINERTRGLRVVASLTVAELLGAQPMLPEVLADMLRDSYYTLNPRGLSVLRQPRSQGKAEDVASLAAAWIDFDAHQSGGGFHDVRMGVLDAVGRGILPEPSLLADSGRGGWAFFLLRDDDDPAMPVPRTPESEARWRRCAVALDTRAQQHLSHLSPDAATTRNVASLSRIPGSINGKSDRRVAYIWQASGSGDVIAYTLSEMEDFLGIARAPALEPAPLEPAPLELAPLELRRVAGDAPTDAPKREADSIAQAHGRTGAIKRWRGKSDAVLTLSDIRGGFAKGTRHNALLVVAYAMKRGQVHGDWIAAKLHDIADAFRPRLPNQSAAVISAMQQAAKRPQHEKGWLSDDGIVRMLRVTDDELTQLHLFGNRLKPLTATKRRQLAVRKAWHELVAQGHREPPVRQVQAFIAERYRISASHGAVHNDMGALFPKRTRRRGTGSAAQATLPGAD